MTLEFISKEKYDLLLNTLLSLLEDKFKEIKWSKVKLVEEDKAYKYLLEGRKGNSKLSVSVQYIKNKDFQLYLSILYPTSGRKAFELPKMKLLDPKTEREIVGIAQSIFNYINAELSEGISKM